MRLWHILLLLVLVAGCSSSSRVIIGDEVFKVEVVKTQEAMAQGLMGRESLEINNGMLFVFPNEGPRSFWMKDTLIPLDIIFISADGTITNIVTAEPCSRMPCKTYGSLKPAKYVLEINANETSRRGIKVDDVIKMPWINALW
jgi:uncharacterized membrane protein (UPF0127 family)